MTSDKRMYNSGARKGELFELKEGLNATAMKDRKKALKRTVAAMTLGKDVSSLFPDVVKNTAGDLAMKKLVYLYIINYAQANADLSILIVNTFMKDAVDQNAQIRALAIRTMALIPLDRITEYLCDPLHAALKDEDPYVRKTAAVCVAKLYDTNPTLAIDEGFITELQELLSDGNPMTVSNAVAALAEIAESSNSPTLLSLNAQTVPHFLSALSECTEWGRIFILDTLSSYVPSSSEEAESIVERVIPHFQHTNAAVVLSSVRIVVNIMHILDTDSKRQFLVKKMSAPLVTLIKGHPELQFAALRNIAILIEEFPELLAEDIRVFFVSYSDPIYVKLEKLNTLVKLTREDTAQAVFAELIEYSGEVDITFAQKSVDSIGKIALNIPDVSNQCVSIIISILKRRAVHLIEQTAITLKDVLRKYPTEFLPVAKELCHVSDQISEPDAKGAFAWILGEHAAGIPSSLDLLHAMCSTINEEPGSAQLQILTAAVKAHFACGGLATKSAEIALKYATEASDNIDVRDRGFIYSRLLSGDNSAAAAIISNSKAGLESRSTELSLELRKELLRSLSTVSAVYHKPTKVFRGARKRSPIGSGLETSMQEEDLLGLDSEEEIGKTATSSMGALVPMEQPQQQLGDSLLDDMLGGSSAQQVPAITNSSATQGSDIGLGALSLLDNFSAPKNGFPRQRNLLLSETKGNGLSVHGGLIRNPDGSHVLEMELKNHTIQPMSGFAVNMNKNMFGFTPTSGLNIPEPITPSSSVISKVVLGTHGAVDSSKGLILQTALKFSPGGIVYFSVDAGDSIFSVLNTSIGPLSQQDYRSKWQSISDATEVRASFLYSDTESTPMTSISQKLAATGVFTVGKRQKANPPVMYFSAIVQGPAQYTILAELTFPSSPGDQSYTLASRGTMPPEMCATALINFNEEISSTLSR